MPFMSQFFLEMADSIAGQLGRDYGQPIRYPIDLAGLLPFSFDVALVQIANLSVVQVNAWFSDKGSQPPSRDHPSRALYGCVVIEQGHAFIFIDSQVTEAEQRFTLAHEFSHYVVEHYYRRQQVQRELGESFVAILDGKRMLTPEDQLIAMRRHIPLRPYQHFMHREADGQIGERRISEAEQRADLLALELIAPHRLLLRRCAAREMFAMQANLYHDLVQQFGLPPLIADSYATQLSGFFNIAPSIRQRLGG